MATIATFLDTTLPDYVSRSRALVADGWKKVPNTKGNRKNIHLKYYEYLVNTNAKIAGLNVRMLTPAQLQLVWEKATAEFNKYEMYVKPQVVVAPGAGMNMEEEAPPVEEHFATENDVARMQPGYVDIDDILAGMERMGFGGGKRHHKKSHKRTHKRRHTKRRHSKRRHTRRY
jgi:hypothetical protein